MNNKIENLLNKHIVRLQADIANRDADNPMDRELNKTDLKNIASLREGRVPQYGDHILCLLGDDEYPMREFSDISEEMNNAAV